MPSLFEHYERAGAWRPWTTSEFNEWRVLKCADSRLRIAGIDVETGKRRLTSALEGIDLTRRAVTTVKERALLLAMSRVEEDYSSLLQCNSSRKWRTLVSRLAPFVDVTTTLFAPLAGERPVLPCVYSAKARIFLETLIDAETPIYWDLVRTAAKQLLKEMPDENTEDLSDVKVTPLRRRPYSEEELAQ